MSTTSRFLGIATGVFLSLAPLPAGAGSRYATPQERDAFRKDEAVLVPSPRAGGVRTAQDDVDVTRYVLDLEFDPSQRSVSGSVTVTFRSLRDGLDHVPLDLADGMLVTSVRRAGKALAFVHGGGLVDVVLDRALRLDESTSIEVRYSGVPVPTGFGSIGWNKYGWGGGQGEMVWTLSEPEGARSWWPCKDRPDDKAMVEMSWTVPEPWVATGNGVLVSVTRRPQGRAQYRWRASSPLPTYLVSIAATGYVSWSETYVGLDGTPMPVTHYVYPEHLEASREAFSTLVPMIAFYAATFGEYPFLADKYGMSCVPWGGAMEHATNTSFGYLSIDPGHANDWMMAHELAHQWWGDSVTPADWRDIWLNEGFATYAEALWFEHLDGAAGYRDYMATLWRETFQGPVYDPLSLFNATVYDKGAWVQHMLRGVVGDAAFFNAQRDWYAQRKDGTGTTAQYQAVVEARHGAPLDGFFGQWVHGTGSPRYEVGWTTAARSDGTFRTTVAVRQVQTNAGTFVMPLTLALRTASGTAPHRVWNDAADQRFVLDSAERPLDVILDPDGWILKASVQEVAPADEDADGVPDDADLCPSAPDPDQEDLDADGAGAPCDLDDDGDLLPDAQDCSPLDASQGTPAEVASLALERVAGAGSLLTWTAAARADVHDVSRGSLAAPGAPRTCLAPGVAQTALNDPAVPLPGSGWTYLVRGRDLGCGGAGSDGSGTSGPRAPACP